ncbi:hypothetical protein [Candidatus Chloroploca asiatica]|uniref:VWFA domain-containing protein n=1 Tax=Candidatus Chloroploca asiatica TaxID=1506545 RepID=A0A2H3KLQ8_9CHLR|nr:hypothetical protein [Candidatus Chloroploca asiatica]PDV98962.1 hypothetical protein A9Q02_14005 [Candidatus Chloroploca asiatica]
MAELPDSLARNFAAAAVSPALRRILLVDLPPGQLRTVAAAFAEALTAAEGRPVELINMALAQDEDTLWGGLAFNPVPDGPPITWLPGLLTRELTNANNIPLVLIPDLAQLGLVGQRACVSLLDNPDARLERHGQSRRWRSQICWLAACRAAELPQVAPHLLDRFALRVEGEVLREPNRVQALRTQVVTEQAEPPPFTLPPAVLAQIGAAMQRPLACPESDVAANVLQLFPDAADAESSRRAVGFARLIMALARLEGKTPTDLLREVSQGQTRTERSPEQVQPGDGAPGTPPKPDQTGSGSEGSGMVESTPQPADAATEGGPGSYEPVAPGSDPGPETLVGGMEATFPGLNMRLYPEDSPRQQASEPLRMPSRRFRASPSASGPIIGVEQTTTTEDLALVATLIEAAKWQRMRQGGAEMCPGRLRLHPGDLRRNRRAPVIEQQLVLVVDHTCRTGFAWVDVLMPHILWAYQARAAVTLVQVGAQDAAHPLRATLLNAPNVLVPQLNTALNAGPGYGTPLAHGLELALQQLRHLIQGGRSAVRQARLVVLSDGRGNLPLVASHSGAVRGLVGRQGFDDALTIAHQLASLSHVERLLIVPEPRLYPELARRLAMAMHAPLAVMTPLDAEVTL